MLFDKEIVLEKYYGRSKNIDEAQKQVSIICKEIRNLTDMSIGIPKEKKNINIETANGKLEDALKKEFGFPNMNITWTFDGTINAYTTFTSTSFVDLPVGYFNKALGKGHNQPLKNVFLFIGSGLITVDQLTDREVMAVILHEIGHQINLAPYKIIRESIWTALYGPTMILTTPLIGTGLGVILTTVNRSLNKYAPRFMVAVNNLQTWMNQFTIFDFKVLNLKAKIKKAKQLKTIITVPLGYGEERMSDKIVVDYGYGPEMLSFIHKIENHHKSDGYKLAKENKYVETMLAIDRVMVGSLVCIVDPHPNKQTRMSQMIKRLKHDAKDKNLPPEMRKELEKELARCEEMYEVNYVSGKGDDEHPIVIAKRQFCAKYLGGNDDVREILAPLYDLLDEH